jgi:uncharacterized protein (TIGR02594 family)
MDAGGRVISQNGHSPQPDAYLKATPLLIARRFLGLLEAAGTVNNPAIVAMLQLDSKWADQDSVPWCSAFVNWCAWLLDLPRSKSLAARSWLNVGTAVTLARAVPGFDVVVLQRGSGDQPGPEVLDAPGHVGFYVGRDDHDRVLVLGGNQGDSVSIEAFASSRVLSIRRL